MIEDLEKQYKLTDLLYNKLREYKKEVAANAKNATKKDCKYYLPCFFLSPFLHIVPFMMRNFTYSSSAKVNLDNLPTSSGISHIEHIERQLAFLSYIYENSSLVLTETRYENKTQFIFFSFLLRSTELMVYFRVDQLWDMLVKNALTSKEREKTLLWLSDKVANNVRESEGVNDWRSEQTNFVTQSLTGSLSEYIFGRILALDPSYMTYTVFSVFINFFLQINTSVCFPFLPDYFRTLLILS